MRQTFPMPTADRRLASSLLAVALLAVAPTSGHGEEVKNVLASDGYYEVTRIDAGTFAIHEPQDRFHNVAYVVKGSQRSILIDSGTGSRDIAFVADKVTKKPMTVVASHLHHDHIGSHASFTSVAMIDLPETRARIHDGRYSPTLASSLSPFSPVFEVTEWWKPGETIDLGGRRLEVVHLPGHSTDAIALVDRASGYAFVGDHLHAGDLYAFLPGADLEAWIDSTRRLLSDFPEIEWVFGGHAGQRLPRTALEDLETLLASIVDGRARGERLWWLGWMVARYPGETFSVLARP
jgi:hydroxyacylglutathione hydrolase